VDFRETIFGFLFSVFYEFMNDSRYTGTRNKAISLQKNRRLKYLILRLYLNHIEAGEIFEKLIDYLPIEKTEIPPRMNIRRPFSSVSKAKREWKNEWG